jgi:hypothetical protein
LIHVSTIIEGGSCAANILCEVQARYLIHKWSRCLDSLRLPLVLIGTLWAS